jgi:alpha-glucosidase
VYQGDELGLPEAWDLPLDVLQDPIWHDSEHAVKGRDGCRVPIPWEPAGESLGFGANGSWLPQPEEYARLAAAVQENEPGSTLELYRTALALRRERLVDEVGFELVDLGPNVLAFRRGDSFMSVTNMGGDQVALPDGDVVLSSGPLVDGRLAPDTTVWLVS